MSRDRFRWGITATAILTFAALIVALAALPAIGFRKGRFTGGGRVNISDTLFATHGFELYCITLGGGGTLDLGPNNLQVNWNTGEHWHLEDLTKGGCADERWDPRPPRAPIDAYYGAGFGRLNGVSGAFACWRLTDDGEPGTNDLFSFRVWAPGEEPNPDSAAGDPAECPSPDAEPVLQFTGLRLERGNHQAHRLNRR